MNQLSIEKRSKIIGMLVEGNSMRAVSRMAGCSINTVTKLLVDVGEACWAYQSRAFRNLSCKRIQCDEMPNKSLICLLRYKEAQPSLGQ